MTFVISEKTAFYRDPVTMAKIADDTKNPYNNCGIMGGIAPPY